MSPREVFIIAFMLCFIFVYAAMSDVMTLDRYERHCAELGGVNIAGSLDDKPVCVRVLK